MSFSSDLSIDRGFWPEKQGPFDNHATSFWKFKLSRDVRKLTIFMKLGEDVVDRTLHIVHAPTLAFLDFSLRHFIGLAEAGKHCRMAHYLQQVYKATEIEIAKQDEHQLVLETWRSTALQEWAVRTGEGLGHSDTGRVKYLNRCAEDNVTPYLIDVVKSYGKCCSIPC
jgi:hypothetical protein